MLSEEPVVLITGGGSGIGKETALYFAERGAKVIIAGRRQEVLEKTAAEIKTASKFSLSIPTDITDEESVQRMVEVAISTFGRVDVLVNNAGIAGKAALLHEMTDDDWNSLLDTNLTGTFRVSRALLGYFIQREKGNIVNVSSIAATVGLRQMAAYSASKSGMHALTRSIAVEYAHLGIRCNCVCPGPVDTPMTQSFLSEADNYRRTISGIPQNRVGRPEGIAAAIYYLGTEQSSFMTGSIMTIDGGYTAI